MQQRLPMCEELQTNECTCLWHTPEQDDFLSLPSTEQKQLHKHNEGMHKTIKEKARRQENHNGDNQEHNRQIDDPRQMHREDKIEWICAKNTHNAKTRKKR